MLPSTSKNFCLQVIPNLFLLKISMPVTKHYYNMSMYRENQTHSYCFLKERETYDRSCIVFQLNPDAPKYSTTTRIAEDLIYLLLQIQVKIWHTLIYWNGQFAICESFSPILQLHQNLEKQIKEKSKILFYYWVWCSHENGFISFGLIGI